MMARQQRILIVDDEGNITSRPSRSCWATQATT